ncbi:MAG TPA: hypothetical protein VJ045_07175 [Hyphomicrobiaceae bacterium]|nr:hypothetical protein [Hyphomicrobiaceae bacterium]
MRAKVVLALLACAGAVLVAAPPSASALPMGITGHSAAQTLGGGLVEKAGYRWRRGHWGHAYYPRYYRYRPHYYSYYRPYHYPYYDPYYYSYYGPYYRPYAYGPRFYGPRFGFSIGF